MTATPDNPLVEALETLTAAPNLFDAVEGLLLNPATPGTVRRMIAHILDLGERLALTGEVTA